MNTLTERIIEAIKHSGKSTTEVAAACGVSFQAVAKWQTHGIRSLKGESLVGLSELSGYQCKWLMTGKGPKHIEYAKNQPQVLALQAMEKLPLEEQYKIPSFVDLLTKPNHTTKTQ